MKRAEIITRLKTAEPELRAHGVDAHEALERACGLRVDYGTRKGLVKFHRPVIERGAIRIF